MTEIAILEKCTLKMEKNISQIQKKTGFDRKTIRKFINKEDWNDPVQAHIERESKLEKFELEIDQWLEADKEIPIRK